MADSQTIEARPDQMGDTKEQDIKLLECVDYLESLVNKVIGAFIILAVLFAVYVFYNFCALR